MSWLDLGASGERVSDGLSIQRNGEMIMRRNYLGLMSLVMASLAVGPIAVLAGGQGGAAGVTPAGTVFTYQGQLDQGGVPVNRAL